jgi:hypothetical protein
MSTRFSRLPGRAMRWAMRRTLNTVRRHRDLRSGTYATDAITGDLDRRLGDLPPVPAPPSAVIDHYLSHRFDLLGSGWVQVRHGLACRGLQGHRYAAAASARTDREGGWLAGRINHSNLAESRRIWSLVDAGYVPIDWQLDFKSGFRWSEQTWYADIRYGHLPGVDIKIPWELARMHHLPQLALSFAARTEAEPRDRLQREFRNQILDFVATNPPRFGVNWACAMDVAIRAANWTLAYDLFQGAGAAFDRPFDDILKRSLYEHGRHIITNLEWYGGIRANHYLADIAGLAFVAAYLPASRESDAWLTFAVQELLSEVRFQFHDDGSNFENSTAYHRLASELVIYATALVQGLPGQRFATIESAHGVVDVSGTRRTIGPVARAASRSQNSQAAEDVPSAFPRWYFERVRLMAEFVRDITKPDGHFPQIGDDDSGRLFKLSPVFEIATVRDAKARYASLNSYADLPDDEAYWLEDHLNAAHIVAATSGLIDCEPATPPTSVSDGRCIVSELIALAPADRMVTEALTAGRRPKANPLGRTGGDELPTSHFGPPVIDVDHGDGSRRTVFRSPESDLTDGLVALAYPDFGLYLIRSRYLYLAIRCLQTYGPTAHLHADQLGLVLSFGRQDVVVDPGTFVYTPLPEMRNRYRSVQAHFTPWQETNGDAIADDLFSLRSIPQAAVHYFGRDGFVGEMGLGTETARRSIMIESDQVVVVDRSSRGPYCRQIDSAMAIGQSPGYGIALRPPPPKQANESIRGSSNTGCVTSISDTCRRKETDA